MARDTKQYTQEQQVILLELGELYDQNGELPREDAEYTCAMAGQRALDVFYDLEANGDLQFAEDGSLDYMPSDEQITGNEAYHG